ncbi:hypothetical protein [Pseudoalteromonas sp. McH1-42]|uniref:ORC-CDC6 family AAA ATPase n=1 Tax=Pseudoalteromonas sp. McH1-42 TaxID=2917752 RepID=UPI001EF713DA|nr:hypothetical protein [Pseudoalteromonas sp. McH1-42]MCG7563326.1 hypothetical protein [Pseudoalteromonas sp. McH1-42]
MRALNRALLKLSKRAEKYTNQQLVESFVDVGPLFTLLSNSDNQVIFGRRGTGKTHVLSYLNNHLVDNNITSVKIDMRTIGSTGGIYSDTDLSISERATRLLSDTLCAIHDGILELVIEDDKDIYDLSSMASNLDRVAEQSTSIVIEGDIEHETGLGKKSTFKIKESISSKIASTKLEISAGAESTDSSESNINQRKLRKGTEKLRIHFASVYSEVDKLVSKLPSSELWILIDEWSEVPLDLQPFLADLLRRTLYPVDGVTVKIAAIEQRCNFRRHNEVDGSYIGIEIGADASASLNLDEFMVFDNDEVKAKEFFGNLLFQHVMSLDKEDSSPFNLSTKARFINDVFTQQSAFEEFVRASEGVPRDAINIIGLAAQKALDRQISIPITRDAARIWYHRSKHKAVSDRSGAISLLDWITNEVIGTRQAKGFLLPISVKDALIDHLFDNRVLHLLKTGVSAQLYPGKRYNVYCLDYGCYVDLLTTKNAPRGLLMSDSEDGEDTVKYIDVPKTDFRSIRNAILNLETFYETQ